MPNRSSDELGAGVPGFKPLAGPGAGMAGAAPAWSGPPVTAKTPATTNAQCKNCPAQEDASGGQDVGHAGLLGLLGRWCRRSDFTRGCAFRICFSIEFINSLFLSVPLQMPAIPADGHHQIGDFKASIS